MFKNIVTYTILAAALANGAPLVDPLELDARDILALSERDVDIAAREIAPRVVTNLTGFADFERFNVSGTTITELGYYGGLFFKGLAAVTNAFLPALQPRSPVNIAAYGAATTTLNSNPFITSRFSGSKTQSFGVSSFFFGCADADGTGAVSCRVAVAGYDTFNRLLAYQTLTFNPTGTSSPFALAPAVLKGAFGAGISTLRLATQYDGNVVGTTALDNIRYSIIQDNSTITTPTSPST
ncbi:hypothetical protein BKA67DRAFT_649851 [Truncatella angustata]|uniref:Uncharacterized protein n=1 Tax=Truncatella angustata TaxID=152316 RepID=A0A9P8RIA8_9PEZI|nr:uncharacterized protein BKA67DRAFT_649851 [Truncatella angustata]KAH6646553.1 hypothetical protein BKA67DRAFT_649851 [Truncatella angustata]KAH8199544.1 hypothetical protein TruAng_006295 [Truncatella angustata]